jgi:regulator of sigma E protease
MVAILVHELGHYLTAVSFRLPVKTFSVGLPLPYPYLKFRRMGDGGFAFDGGMAALSWRIGTLFGTEFYIAPVLFGGYVEFDREGTLTIENAPGYQRIIVLIGGVVFNFVFGYIALVARSLARGDEIGAALMNALYNLVTTIVMIPALIFSTIAGGNFEAFTGPIGIVTTIGSTTGDLVLFFSIIAILNISLGVMNLIPIGPLDGTRILITLVEMVARRELPSTLKNGYMIFGMLGLFALLIYSTFSDIGRIFGW